ncbi:MAG: TldD/PmbA family protein [Desulfurococcales archaeon]|nr:TldD/PmbA family protein [Desulfurococcales archaeon]
MHVDVEKLLSLAKRLGASEAEIYIVRSKSVSVEARRSELEQASMDEVTRIGVRTAIGKKVGAAGGVAASESDAEKIIEEAIKIARTAPEDPNWPGFNPNVGAAQYKLDVFDEPTASLSSEDLVELLLGQLKIVKAEENVVASEAGVEAGIVEATYTNTGGGIVEGRRSFFSYGIELKKTGSEGEGTFYDYFTKARLEPDRVETTTLNALKMVSEAVKARPIETIRGDLVLTPDEASSIIATLISPAISAEQAQKGRSPLKDRLGVQVLDKGISIIDDPFLPWEPGSATWDDEGHPTSRKAVFEDGVFKTFLYDYYAASREGKSSTGNASRRMPWSTPTPAPANLVVKVKDRVRSIDDLLAEIETGILVVRTIGSWMSNPVNGQINATISFGFLVSKGSIERPVKGLVLTDNIYEVLGPRFVNAGGEPECRGGVCTSALHSREVTFSGKG